MALDFVAGSIGGAAGLIVGHPFDTVKVRLQTQSNGRYKGITDCFMRIIKEEKFKGLYKGVTSPLAGVAFINSVQFGVYANFHRWINSNGGDKHMYRNFFLAGAVSGAAQAFICSPVELVKLRMQLQGIGEASHLPYPRTDLVHYETPWDCARKIVKQSGIRGLYRGIGMTMLRDCPAIGTYFLTYEWLWRKMATGGPETLSSFHLLLCGGIAGPFSWFMNYPADVLKSRYQADGVDPKNCKYSSYVDCVKKSYEGRGWRVFTQGLGSTLLRAIPTNAVTFLTVEWILRLCTDFLIIDHDVSHCPVPEHHFHHHHWEEDHRMFLSLPEAGGFFHW